MKKKHFIFAAVLLAACAMNVRTVLNTEHSSDLMATSLVAIGEGNPNEGSGNEGSSGIQIECQTIVVDSYEQTASCMQCGRIHTVSIWESTDCNRGVFSFCYPGYKIKYLNCDKTINSITDVTNQSSCTIF